MFFRKRLLKGPEYCRLIKPDLFFQNPWKIASDSNEIGLRLKNGSLSAVTSTEMISDAVADGTIQLTPGGPILLLYHRQTVGGYPRIFNVISADMDLLAQFMPGEWFRFRQVTLKEAQNAAKKKIEDLNSFRKRF